jgi:hypothetical protein
MFINTAEVKKEILLEMAKNGEKRPSQYSENLLERTLGMALDNYARKGGCSYDPDFIEQIKEIRPDWWRKSLTIQRQVINFINKNKRLPSNSKERGKEEQILGRALSNYASPNNKIFNPRFRRVIQRLIFKYNIKVGKYKTFISNK